MRPQAIIVIVVFIIMTAAVILWVLPDKSSRLRNNPPTHSVTITATNDKGEKFTVRLAGIIINGTNAPITNGNIRFTIPDDK